MTMNNRERRELDNHITGHYGEDQFREQDEDQVESQIESPATEQATDYLTYRGRCKELAEAACEGDDTLKLVRGFYLCPIWGKQPHWWCVKPDGTIIDPSVKQFPTAGVGAEYMEFDGNIECEYCHKEVPENDAYFHYHHAYCSYECFGHDIGF